MKYLIILISIISISGCATTRALKYDVPGIEASSSLVVSDLRPQTEKEQKVFSLMITSDAYAIYRNGETGIEPTPLRLFQHRAYEKFSNSKSPIDIKIHHFVSYLNFQSALRKVAVGSAFGAIGAVVASTTLNNKVDPSVSLVNPDVFNAMLNKEYQRALYSPQENPNKATLYVIYIDADINGKRVFIRKTSPTFPKDGTNPYAEAVDSTIKAFLSHYESS